MIDAIVGVGVPLDDVDGGRFDFWLPTYILLSSLLIRFMVRVRRAPACLIAAFAAGTLWAWWAASAGTVPAAALALLLAMGAGRLRRRARPERSFG